MSIGEPSKLNNYFPSKSPLIQSLSKKLCSWGKRRLKYDMDNNARGTTSPLWTNPFPRTYHVLFILKSISSIIFVIFYGVVVLYNSMTQNKINSNASTHNSTNGTLILNSTIIPSNGTSDDDATCLTYIAIQINHEFIIIGSGILLLNGI